MNVCRSYKEKLVLLVYDELSAGDSADLEAHIKICPTCTKELAALQQLRTEASHLNVSDEILQPTRRALFYKLRTLSNARQPQVSPWWNIGKLVLQAGLAVLLVFFGFKLGQQKSSAQPTFAMNDLLTATRMISVKEGSISPYLIGVDKIIINPVDGAVEISFNTINDVRVLGHGDDPAVQHMLQFALLNKNDPSLQLRAVKTVEHLASSTTHLDASYLEALDQLLNEESNIGIKLSILKILETLKDNPQAHDILIQSMLTESNEAVRIQAFKSLTQTDASFLELDKMLSTTKMDSNTYIRTKSLELLKDRKETSL